VSAVLEAKITMHDTTERRITHLAHALTLALSSAFFGCQGEPEPQADTDETGSETGDGDALATTFWQDVAPIYYDSCVSCHREGGIAPFTLDDYASAAAWAKVSATAVENRQMPPWLITDDGSCNEWQHSRALPQEQIDTILAWVDEGTPEGTPRDDLELPELPGLDGATVFATPQFVPEPEGGIFSKYDEYRCFLIDPALEQDAFITGHEIIPGNEALVHHVLVAPVDPQRQVGGGMTNLERIESLAAESPDREGWSCFGVAGDGVEVESLPVSWAPGQGAVELPAGSGSRVRAGDLLVVQVHYNMTDPEVIGQSDSTTVKLRLADEVAREGLFDLPAGLIGTLYEGEPYQLPPGEEAHEFTWRIPADWYIGWQGSEQLELWGFFPHMHDLGTQLSARVLDEQGQEVGCLAEVLRWDFDWQLYYFLEQPIVLEPGYEIEVTCTYDTTTVTEPVWPGWGTQNEMCVAGVYLVAPE
jgi:hypothetical protein